MTLYKKLIKSILTLTLAVVLTLALVGCDDLGEYESVDEYYSSYGDIVMISASSGDKENYSVEDYFYNEQSRKNFLKGDDGSYSGVPFDDYVYVAIPFKRDVNMDSLAIYVQAEADCTAYINVYLTDKIPSSFRGPDNKGEFSATDDFDDPDPKTRIAHSSVRLTSGVWNSFLIDSFISADGTASGGIQVKNGAYALIQIRNNSGIRIFDQEKQAYVDSETAEELSGVRLTMTNLLIRAIELAK